MNKLAFLFILLLITVVYIFKKDRLLSDSFPIINTLKTKYIEKVITTQEMIEKYFKQITTIERLATENEELVKYRSLYTSAHSQLLEIENGITSVKNLQESVTLAKVLSYVKLNDFTKVWLDIPKTDDKIEALIDGDYSAGIVINQSGHAMALLNGNEKCNYAVFIGENRAPGITHQNSNSQFITIKYVPIWVNINVGDEVITSGMDNIFFLGLKVGRVVSIKKMADIQEATVLPYSNTFKKQYFHIYSKPEQALTQQPTAETTKKPL
ncbi:MAG: rod shape-determining protein MreC [Candidatus Marinarcus sp.]|uniref:rod shape-determining protein MreC n=1 Tax=Candidatus Marinarcus sp. TaxID=3100987 RepID=UPI003B004C80